MQEKIKEVMYLKFPNAKARVTRPELSKEEYERRERELIKASENMLKAQQKARRENANGNQYI